MITNFHYADGAPTPLSNFWLVRAPIYYDLRPVSDINVWPTAEHLYQACKAITAEQVEAIRAASTPGQAKRRGHAVPLSADWEARKLGVMRSVLLAKFYSDAEARAYLLATGDHLLVEGNTWGDRFWGQCPVGQGENWLGVLLMALRAQLRAC